MELNALLESFQEENAIEQQNTKLAMERLQLLNTMATQYGIVRIVVRMLVIEYDEFRVHRKKKSGMGYQ